MVHRNVAAGTPADLIARTACLEAGRTGLEPAPDEVEERAVRSRAGAAELEEGLVESRSRLAEQKNASVNPEVRIGKSERNVAEQTEHWADLTDILSKSEESLVDPQDVMADQERSSTEWDD